MKTRPIYVIPLGAIAIAWISVSLSADVQGAPTRILAASNDKEIQLAQQDKKDAPAKPAKPAKPAAQSAGPGWAVNCKSEATEQGLECRLSQTVVTRQGGQILTKATFLFAADKKSSEVIVQLPLGLFLPAGATIQVDDKAPQSLTFRACDRGGCYARSPVSAEMLAMLQKGKQLQVSFQNLEEDPIDVPLSLDGFPAAYSKIQR
jgi:invasion protein IalB